MSDESCAGLPLVIDWHLTKHLFFIFEVPLDEVERILPAPLAAVELRPGVGLLSVGVLRYMAGHFGRPDSPAFDEVVAGLHVQPDLSLDMPPPRFAFFALSVFSDSIDFVEQEGHTLWTPTRHVPSLKVSWREDGGGAEVWDDEGPMMSLQANHPSPNYTPTRFYGQHYTFKGREHGLAGPTGGELLRGIWSWTGTRYETMQRGNPSRLFPHSFFRGLDVTRHFGSHTQMVALQGVEHRERFYEMQAVADPPRRQAATR